MSTSSDSINYAKLFGFKSIPAAVIFAICYLPLCLWFIPKVIMRRTYAVFTVTLFCLMRFAAFIIRVALLASNSIGEDENVFIVDEVLFSIGFFGLLYGAYGLVLDRRFADAELNSLALCATSQYHENPVNAILSNRKLFHLVLLAGLIMGIIGITDSTGSSPSSSGTTLRKASVIVFLILTLLQAYQTFTLRIPSFASSLLVIPSGLVTELLSLGPLQLFLLVREIYLVSTISSTIKQNKEDTWYPLVALPELICVVLYALPGVIPPTPGSSDLPR
ncbi:hypothetical protein BT96DRAFT_934554 [Gymnopus androsaceus JB14]|uniref:Uncharacterized protein n=1 Tax=Gymnopus androsaceus JB14 TaxID=1447944 RepID=A0A6A4IAI4_9AGAR|nr:hypothetical protein BT96DRAFT_934554 [Gymnopus androsaceus JB14]